MRRNNKDATNNIAALIGRILEQQRKAATPSVDAGKETFSRKDMQLLLEWTEKAGNKWFLDDDGFWKSFTKSDKPHTTAQVLDEYLNQLNKQK